MICITSCDIFPFTCYFLFFFFFNVTNKIVNTKEAILTYDKYYIKDDGVAELGQLYFCGLQISFSIQTFWSYSLQIRVNSAMVSHDTVCNSFEYTVLYSVFILYALHITLYYITVCLITSQIMFRLNTGRNYRDTNVVLPLDFKSYGSGEL